MGGSSTAKRRYYERNRELCIERTKVWRENNRERYNAWFREKKKLTPEESKRRARGYSLKRKYGLSLDQYDELLEKQDGCCAICARHYTEFKIPLAVDHSHKTRIIRGLLCTSCNYRLVSKHEDGDLLRKIADYIEQGTEWIVPARSRKTRRRRNGRS